MAFIVYNASTGSIDYGMIGSGEDIMSLQHQQLPAGMKYLYDVPDDHPCLQKDDMDSWQVIGDQLSQKTQCHWMVNGPQVSTQSDGNRTYQYDFSLNPVPSKAEFTIRALPNTFTRSRVGEAIEGVTFNTDLQCAVIQLVKQPNFYAVDYELMVSEV